MRIVFSPEARLYLEELAHNLYFNIYYTGSEIVYLVRYINNNHYIGRFL